MKKKVLFLCTHNSARSQMAEGLLRAMYGSNYEAYSAGTKPSTVNPYVIRAMAEIGIDLSQHRSKSVTDFLQDKFDFVVTVCDNAKEGCPFFPGGKAYLHESFNDPSGFAGIDEQVMEGVRAVRDDIQRWIRKTFEIGY